MTTNKIIAATIIGLSLSFAMAPLASAADNEPAEITFDNGQLFESCMLDGGKTKNGKKTYSCTVDGKTTTCDKKPADKDAPCSTQIGSKKNRFIPVFKQATFFSK